MGYSDGLAIPPATTGERRQHRRIQVLLSVDVEGNRRSQIARVVEFSPGGLRLRLASYLASGTQVVVRRGSVEIPCRIAWNDGTMAGIEFLSTIDEHAFLRFRRGR